MPSDSLQIARLTGRVARMAWRMSRVYRPGTVLEYDPGRHRARVALSTPGAKGGRSPWAPVQEARGHRTTLTPGEAVWLFCPNGDLRQAVVQLGLYTRDTTPGADGAEESSFERGDGRVSLRPDRARVNFGGAEVDLTDGEARMTLGGAEVRLTGSEARMSMGGGSIKIDASGKVSLG